VSLLEARAITCTRGVATLFRDVSFSIAAGEWIALRGANGTGKTTLLRCIAGLTRPDSGEVMWNAQATHGDAAAFHGALLYAGHTAGIKDDLSAEENLRDALQLRGAAADSQALRSALGDAGLDKRRHLPARRLSAGQRRRIGLARLALDPATVWALDEPLTALDDDGQRLFTGLLQRHLARGGIALVATHHPFEVAPTREIRMGA
jgi:heme exporter protein A